MPPVYGVRLGRLRLLTVQDNIAETLGGTIETIGRAVAAGDRRAREFSLSIPLHGDTQEADPYATGERLRRQMVALLENDDLLAEGLYFDFDADPDLNGWLRVGGGQVNYGEGGPSLADYIAELTDVYKVGSRATHRGARRLTFADTGLITTPRDYRKRIYSTDYAGETALALHALPPGVTDLADDTGAPVFPITRPCVGGSVPFAIAQPNATVVSYEQLEAAMFIGDVIAYDRRGSATPAPAVATDDPEALYGWEETYGPDQPLTAGDVPVLQNGICRVRWVGANGAFAIDQFVTPSTWTERCRITASADGGGTGFLAFSSLLGATVLELTPERAVVEVTLGTSPAGSRGDLIITLTRGDTAPRFEFYPYRMPGGAYTLPRAALRLSPFDTAEQTAAAGESFFVSSLDSWTGALVSPLSVAARPRVTLQGSGPALAFAVNRDDGDVQLTATGEAYGTTRNALLLRSIDGGSEGYVSMRIGIAARAGAFEAEAFRVVDASTAQTADGTARGGQKVTDNSTVAGRTLRVTNAPTTLGCGEGTFNVWARLRSASAATVNARVESPDSTYQATQSPSLAAGVWTWVRLAAQINIVGTAALSIELWRGTAALAEIDAVILHPVQRRLGVAPTYSGPGDLAEASSYDSRSTPELVAR